jgi:hypothetical protein
MIFFLNQVILNEITFHFFTIILYVHLLKMLLFLYPLTIFLLIILFIYHELLLFIISFYLIVIDLHSLSSIFLVILQYAIKYVCLLLGI